MITKRRSPGRIAAVTALLGLVSSVGVADAQSPTSAPSVAVAEELGPNGEVPVAGITDDDVATLAKSSGMSMEDSRFVLFEGSKILADFNVGLQKDPEFGALNVLQDGKLTVQLRVTDSRSSLPDQLADAIDRPVEVFVGGLSAAELNRVTEETVVAMSATHASPSPIPYRVRSDFDTGQVVVEVPPAGRTQVDQLDLPDGVLVRSNSTVEFEESASFAGTARNPTCTIGFALQNGSGTHALMTSGHCSDSGSLTAYGFNLGNAQNEACAITDSQIHTTAATQIWEGFYNNAEQWTNIHAVAGGWYPGQDFFRRGKTTIKATGTISDIQTVSVGAGGDCGVRNVTGFVLTNSTGARIDGGDSGGPMFLAYNGAWYLGGIASTTGPSGSGGRVAWRTVPAGWTACTAQFNC